MAALVEMSEEHWDMVTMRMKLALDEKRVAPEHVPAFVRITKMFEKSNDVRGVPNAVVLEMVKAIRHPWGTRDAELTPLADALETAAKASIARGED